MTELTTETVPFFGADFHVAERIGLMPMMRFAVVAKAGVDANELEGLAAMYELLQQCIHEDDWKRFERHANDSRASGDDLMGYVGEVMAVVAKRPTGRSADSSAGPRIIEPSSPEDSSSPGTARVIDLFNEKGRPDLALLVRRRQESLTG